MAATHRPFHRHHAATGVVLSGPGRAAAHAGTLGTTLEGDASTDLEDLVTYVENLAVGAPVASRLVKVKGPCELECKAYAGAVYSPYQNRIYLVPHGQATSCHWHYIDCSSGEVVSYEHGASDLTCHAYWGGSL